MKWKLNCKVTGFWVISAVGMKRRTGYTFTLPAASSVSAIHTLTGTN